MAGDILWPQVALSMDCNGTNGGNSFIDNKGNSLTTGGGTPITSTSWGITGGSSLYFNGTSYIQSTSTIPLLNFGSGDFEINLWVNMQVAPSANAYSLLSFNSDSPIQGWRFYINTNRTFSFLGSGVGTITSPLSALVPVGTAAHLSVTRVGGTATLRLDGATVQSQAFSGTITAFAGALFLGSALGAFWRFNGFIDRIEVLSGAVRHTTDFTPETSAFVPYAGQLSGVVTSDLGTPAARLIRAYDRSSGNLIGSTTSDAITGAYSLDLPTLDPTMLIGLDDDAGIAYNAIVWDRLTPA